MPCLAVAVSAEDPEWKVGDSWTYSWSDNEENLSISGKVVMKVDATTQVTVGGHLEDAFVVQMSGTGSASGNFESLPITATVNITGSEVRLQSNFSLVRTTMGMTMAMTATGMSVTMSMGTSTTMTPPQMDLPIGENLALGASFHSIGNETGSTWMVIMGMNQSETIANPYDNVLTVTQVNVSVNTPAGTFKCAQLEDSSYHVTQGSYYYSPKVGNYVKYEITGTNVSATSLGNLVLEDFKHGSSDSSIMLYVIIGAVIAAVVVVAIVAVMMMRKRGPPAPAMQPQGQYNPPPPPPGPPSQPGP